MACLSQQECSGTDATGSFPALLPACAPSCRKGEMPRWWEVEDSASSPLTLQHLTVTCVILSRVCWSFSKATSFSAAAESSLMTLGHFSLYESHICHLWYEGVEGFRWLQAKALCHESVNVVRRRRARSYSQNVTERWTCSTERWDTLECGVQFWISNQS